MSFRLCLASFLILASVTTSRFAVAQELPVWLGIDVIDFTVNGVRGVKVIRVNQSGPAARAGLAVDDVILSIDDAPVADAHAFTQLVLRPKSARLRVRLLRGPAEILEVIQNESQAAINDQLMPVMETGGHRAIIRALTFAVDGRYLFSAGDDKVIRKWDMQTGTTDQIIREESRPGREGQILTLAISSDGTWLAAAGWFTIPGQPGYLIRLYDARTGALHSVLVGHHGRIGALAFSKDGRLLLSGSEDNTAIIWDMQSRRPLHVLKGHAREIYAVAFTQDDKRVVTGGYDRMLKIWRVADGAEVKTLSGHRGMVSAIAVSPFNGAIVSGSGLGEVFFWDQQSGRLLRALPRQTNVIGNLVFSADGKKLLTTTSEGSSTFPQRVWDVMSGKQLVSYDAHNDGVSAATISPDQRFAVTAGGSNHEVHIWNLVNGKVAQSSGGEPLILRGGGSSIFSVGFSTDDRKLLWGDTSAYKSHSDRGGFTYQFSMPDAANRLHSPERFTADAASTPRRAELTHGILTLQHAPGGQYGQDDAVLMIRQAGKTIASITRGNEDGYGHFAYTFTPDGQRVISGGANGHLLAYDLTGKVVGMFVGHEGVVWSVAASKDSRFLVSGSADQTVRIWNLETYELVASLFNGRDGEWVVWLPQGYYASSPEGDALVGWQINRGADKEPEFYTARQLKSHFYRPYIVERAFALASSGAAVKEAKAYDPDGMSFELNSLLDRTPPMLSIVDPVDRKVVTGTTTTITVDVRGRDKPIKRLEVFVNGAQVTPVGQRGFLPVATGEDHLQQISLPLSEGENHILVRALNDIGMTEKGLTLFSTMSGNLDKKGTLFIVSVGVNKYPHLSGFCSRPEGISCDLEFAGADARAFHDQLIKSAGPLHGDVKSIVLTNGTGSAEQEPTLANIVDALDLLRNSNDNDTVVIFLSGHGVNDNVQGRPQYLFLPTDAHRTPEGGWRSSTVLSWAALEEGLAKARGRRILFVDTCHAANSYSAQIVKNSHDDNIAVFSATDRDATAVERRDLGHGVFTYVVLRGLQGEAARDREVRLFGFADFVDRLVRELTKEAQQPEINTQRVKNYLIARS
jgi:WD40 repeat protein